MESAPPSVPLAPAETAVVLSPWQRAVAVFTRPSQAWAGLERHHQWWFPLIVMVLFNVAFATALHDRAIAPMITERWDEMVENGQMTAEQAARAQDSINSPVMRGVMVGQQAITWVVFMLLSALGIWFGIGFLLGVKFPFRLAFEVTTWSSLVLIPAQILTGVLAWIRESVQGVHVGWAVLLPEAETPTKLMAGLTAFLDALGPFSIWSLFVSILGAAALSRAPRRPVAWVLSGLYLVFALVAGALAAVFTPGRA